jgi:hypothetical protein
MEAPTDGSTLKSDPPYVFPVAASGGKAAIEGAQVKDDSVVITGIGFPEANPASMTLQLHSDTAKNADYSLSNAAFKLPSVSEADVNLQGLKDKDGNAVTLEGGCWTVKAEIGGTAADGEAAFPILSGTPTITAAKLSKDGKTIDVAGQNFVDLGACGDSLVFKLLNNKTHKSQRVTGYQ